MPNSAETTAPRADAIDSFVVRLTSAQAEAAWSVVQGQRAYTDEELREPAVQGDLAATLSVGVPDWQEVVAAIEAGLDLSGIVLVRGARFDPENRLSIGLISSFSRPSNYGHWKDRLVYDLVPLQRAPGTSDFETFFHTGSQSHDRPHELQSLECVRPGSMGGGVSQLIAIDAALDLMRERGQQTEITNLMCRQFPFKRPAFMGEVILKAPIVEPDPRKSGQHLVRFQREVVFDGAAAEPGSIDDEMQAAIGALEAAWNTVGASLEYAMQAGELSIIDNRRILHARTAVIGGKQSGRHLKRIKAYRP